MPTQRQSFPDHVVAFHEAGHAEVGWRVGLWPRSITIAPSGDAAGHVDHKLGIAAAELEYRSPHRLMGAVTKNIMVSLAGEIAQRRYDPRSVRRYQGRSDRLNAAHLAAAIGADGKEATALLRWLAIRTEKVVGGHWRFIELVAQALVIERTICRARFRELAQIYCDAPAAGA
jgi:hypothetical protein